MSFAILPISEYYSIFYSNEEIELILRLLDKNIRTTIEISQSNPEQIIFEGREGYLDARKYLNDKKYRKGKIKSFKIHFIDPSEFSDEKMYLVHVELLYNSQIFKFADTFVLSSTGKVEKIIHWGLILIE